MKQVGAIGAGLLLLVAVSCTSQVLRTELPQRPPLPQGTPDLTKGEGPDVTDTEAIKHDWFLHCGRTRGWIYRDELGDPSLGRQILVTKVPATSSARKQLQVGDVILGVNGKYFDKHAVYQFRETALPAKKSTPPTFDVILWRKGWDSDRVVTLSHEFLPLDFTKGEKPGMENDWNLGPTGARGYMQGQKGESIVTRQILVTDVQAGSPADDVLQQGDVILGVEGKAFTYDARRAFADAINRAETVKGGGRFSVRRWRDGKTKDVIIPIQVLGSYSDTTPWDCEKSDRIVDQAVAYLLKLKPFDNDAVMSFEHNVAVLALMATGNPEHLKIARERVYQIVKVIEESGKYPPDWNYVSWGWGYTNLVLCEYYLLTKDQAVLPAIEKLTILLAEGQSAVGSWGHRFAAEGNRHNPGYGALNQVGNICWLSLLLAKECGIEHPALDRAVQMGKAFLDTYVDCRTVPYGDGPSVDARRHDDNGKNSTAAVAYAIYGDERGTDYYARMVVASYTYREFGHTGVWWSHLWGPLAAARAGQPATTAFLDEIGWLYDFQRQWDGGFTYQGKMEIGYGVDENGRQKVGSEHTTPHWDTTACRILMYTLPRKKLYITGRNVLTVPIAKDEVADVIEAGRAPAEGNINYQTRYDDRSPAELIELLGSWSPVVRTQAAQSLSRKPDPTQYEAQLIKLAKGGDHYAAYGGCSALRHMKAGSDAVVDAMVSLLDSDDLVLKRHAVMTLGATDNKRAIKPLLQVAVQDTDPNDPLDLAKRAVAQALFQKGMLLADSIEGVDRALLIAATRSLLACKGGTARKLVTRGVVNKLSRDELDTLWPNLTTTMLEFPSTEVVAASTARLDIAELIAKSKLESGPKLLFEYLKRQRQHGAGARHKIIIELIKGCGAAAKPILPELKQYLAFIKQEHPWVDRSRPSPAGFYKAQVPLVEQLIKDIEAATDQPMLYQPENLD